MTKNIGDLDAAFTRMETRNARLRDAASGIAEVRAQGQVPPSCGPEIPLAPARGPFRTFQSKALYPKGRDGFEIKPAGFEGRDTIERLDAFGVMSAQAAKRGKRGNFTATQVATGRYYRNIVERHAAAGAKCSSLERLSGGGGGASDFMDAVLHDRLQIDRIRRRIGTASAMVVRRIRPSSRRSRVSIMDRRLVDAVCLEDQTISDVLRAHGWAIKGETVKALTCALRECLDRIIGAGASGRINGAHFGNEPPKLFG